MPFLLLSPSFLRAALHLYLKSSMNRCFEFVIIPWTIWQVLTDAFSLGVYCHDGMQWNKIEDCPTNPVVVFVLLCSTFPPVHSFTFPTQLLSQIDFPSPHPGIRICTTPIDRT
ncbi:hypothetical protein DL95DRAFT_138248 [Leptodontidium sp. 2 PMI_412]|nr:hypothetical protein DL95DRAFT_138248 [Leptodontidium sp. 2 PMI_412]